MRAALVVAGREIAAQRNVLLLEVRSAVAAILAAGFCAIGTLILV